MVPLLHTVNYLSPVLQWVSLLNGGHEVWFYCVLTDTVKKFLLWKVLKSTGELVTGDWGNISFNLIQICAIIFQWLHESKYYKPLKFNISNTNRVLEVPATFPVTRLDSTIKHFFLVSYKKQFLCTLKWTVIVHGREVSEP